MTDQNESLHKQLTKHNQAGVGICGAQRILGCAAKHGAIELSRDSLQDEFPSVMDCSAIEQIPTNLGPSEYWLREDFTLWTHKCVSMRSI